MAHCPKCSAEMGVRDTICPHCGYDFPEPKTPTRRLWLHLLLIGVIVLVVVFFRDNPVVAAVIGICGILFYLSLLLGLWRLIRGD